MLKIREQSGNFIGQREKVHSQISCSHKHKVMIGGGEARSLNACVIVRTSVHTSTC